MIEWQINVIILIIGLGGDYMEKKKSTLKRIRLDQQRPNDGITLAVVGAGTGSTKVEENC